MQETQAQSLGGEDPLEKEMATHSSILAWTIPLAEEPIGLWSMGVAKESDTTYWLNNKEISLIKPVTIYFSLDYKKWKSLSLVQLFGTPWTI